MGHTWSEMYPEEAARQRKLDQDRDKVEAKLSKKKLSEFTVEDLLVMLRIYVPNKWHSFNEEDLKHLQRLAKK